MQTPKKKLLIVVQRYGTEVCGGSEMYAREWAQRLSKSYDVTVATTCAQDSNSWANVYPEAEGREGLVAVKRFHVDQTRNIDEFSAYSLNILNQPAPPALALQEEWMTKQGPMSSGLFNYLENHSFEYDVVLFMTYLYATTVFGMREVPSSVSIIFVPTAHDEDPIYLPIFREGFQRADLVVFNSEAEKRFCAALFPEIKKSCLVGCGIDVPLEREHKTTNMQHTPYLIYVGRISPNKGFDRLFWFHRTSRLSKQLPFHLVGAEQMVCPRDPCFVYHGFLPSEQKDTLVQNALAMVIPSPYESFSFSTLEAWACKKPVIVNGNSEVLTDHVTQSHGGLVFHDKYEYHECLEYAYAHPQEMTLMGLQGYEYVRKFYDWSVVEQRLCEGIESLITTGSASNRSQIGVQNSLT